MLPISYADAQPLLAALTGRVAPADWRGGLGMTYRVGPGPAKVHLKVKSNWDIKPVYDVIAKIPGSTAPDEWVMRGNHHDAWVNGAEDPISGIDAVLEEARAMGELLKQGWKPKRTIIFAAWDGEEPGLLGSTEFAEEHADELKQHAVAYINSDTNGRGYLFIEGSHTLEKFTNEVSKDITDPETKLSAWKRNQLREIANAHSPSSARKLASVPISASPRSVPAPTTPRSCNTTASPASISASAAKTAAASIIPSTTISTGTRISATPISSTAARSRKLAARW